VKVEVNQISTPSLNGPPVTLTTKQELTVFPTLKVLGLAQTEEFGHITSEFQMTIQTKVTRMTPKQASILLKVMAHRAVYQGIDVSLYLSMEHLRNVLVKSGHDLSELMDEKNRKAVMLAELICSWCRGEWLSFYDRELLPPEVAAEIKETGWLPSDRTLQSWKQVYEPDKFLQLKIVPLDTLMERSENFSERYTGYTKGYGNDGSPTSPQITKRTAELDGNSDPLDPPVYQLLEFEMYQNLLLSIERAKALKRRKD
jgi:hypothetical protein